MKEITMVTGNLGKWRVASDIFSKFNIKLCHEKMDTPEIQSHNVEDVSMYSAKYAAKEINKSVIKSDVGYYIESLNGFPGPFLRYANEMLSSEDILKMMEGKENRTIYLKECLTFATPEGETKQFVNIEKASLSEIAMGEGTTFDRIVVFEGEKHPKSMNTEEENYAHFEKTLTIYYDMAKYLESMEVSKDGKN